MHLLLSRHNPRAAQNNWYLKIVDNQSDDIHGRVRFNISSFDYSRDKMVDIKPTVLTPTGKTVAE